MGLPLKRNLEIYKGTTFKFKVRFKADGDTFDLSGYEIRFQAGQRPPTSTLVFNLSTTDSPSQITIDSAENNLVTFTIPTEDTTDLTAADLYYQIDLVDTDGVVTRWLIGTIVIFESADA